MKIPDFASEEEEANWWFDNQDALDDEFIGAGEAGLLGRGTVARLAGLPARLIELTPADFELAKQKAAQQNMPYYEYMNHLIHSALVEKAA